MSAGEDESKSNGNAANQVGQNCGEACVFRPILDVEIVQFMCVPEGVHSNT